MSDDKRKVSTDALETLGTIIGPDEKRDAIHLAVIPAQAKHSLRPGEHVQANGSTGPDPVGIVDPFIPTTIHTGDWFWLVIYPRQITSLRHVWSHPAFPEELQPGSVGFKHTKEESKLWLTAWLDSSDTPLNYEQFIDLLENHSVRLSDYAHANLDESYIHIFGRDACGEIPSEVWDHVENILGRRQVLRPTYFSCGC